MFFRVHKEIKDASNGDGHPSYTTGAADLGKMSQAKITKESSSLPWTTRDCQMEQKNVNDDFGGSIHRTWLQICLSCRERWTSSAYEPYPTLDHNHQDWKLFRLTSMHKYICKSSS